MFSRFAAALYSAVDVLAPPVPLQEDFIWHWKSVTKFFTSRNVSNKISIELTSIPGHLLEMIDILEQEQKELDDGSIGPCMEYIMEYKLLETMHALGTADTPPGMKRHMLLFLTRLLKNTQSFLIPYVGMFVPITKFIKLCGEIIAAPTEKEEIEFLEVICTRVKDNPYLLNCFVETFSVTVYRNSLSQTTSVGGEGETNVHSSRTECTLINSLLSMFHSPDHGISVRAGECLLICCSLSSDSTAMAIVQNTDLCQMLCNCMVLQYNNLSKNMKLNELIEPIETNNSESLIAQSLSPDRRKFLCYVRHLSFLDAVMHQCPSVISKGLSSAFQSTFLDTIVKNDLVSSQNEDINIFTTTLILISIQYINSPSLVSSFSSFLFGEIEGFDVSTHSSCTIKDLLIERCQKTKENPALSMATLQLFEVLLQKPNEFVLNNLVINYLESRTYLDPNVDDLIFSDDDNDSFIDHALGESTRQYSNKTFSVAYIDQILESFLSLVPDDIKSSETEEECGYDTYIKEAHERFIKCLSVCEEFNWPQEPVCKGGYHIDGDDSSSESQPEADSSMHWRFYEGPFLCMLFDLMEQMLELPYDINLQLTSLFSRLVLFDHPNLHEYMLNPLLSRSPGTRSLFTVLLKVMEDVKNKLRSTKSFKLKIHQTRRSLLTDDNDYEAEESNVLKVLIVIEEFSKELAAIAFVKYHAAS